MSGDGTIRFGLMGYGKNYKVDVRNFDRFTKQGITLDELKEAVGKENIKNIPLFEKMFTSIAKDDLLDANELFGYFKSLDKAAELNEKNLMLSNNELLRSTGEELGDILQANELAEMGKLNGYVGKKTDAAETETMFQFVTALIQKNDELVAAEDSPQVVEPVKTQEEKEAELTSKAAQKFVDNVKRERAKELEENADYYKAKAESKVADEDAEKAHKIADKKFDDYCKITDEIDKIKAEKIDETLPQRERIAQATARRERLAELEAEAEAWKEVEKARSDAQKADEIAREKGHIFYEEQVKYDERMDLKNRTITDPETGNKTILAKGTPKGMSATYNAEGEKLYDTYINDNSYSFMSDSPKSYRVIYTKAGNNKISEEYWEEKPDGGIIHKIMYRNGKTVTNEADEIEMPENPYNKSKLCSE